MSVYSKLMKARIELQSCKLNKSGQNKFAGYSYFELSDFLPAVQEIFNEIGLCDVTSFTQDIATMTIYDVDDGTNIVFTSPFGSASLKGCHEIQNIGACQTYHRRFFLLNAMAIVEHDGLDATTGKDSIDVKAILQNISRSMTLDLLKTNFNAASKMLGDEFQDELKVVANKRKSELLTKKEKT